MNTHTQTDSPWKIEPFAFGWRIVGASGVEVAEIARSLNPDHKANARLIAAAPDLLAALQSLTHPMASDEDLQNALAVIAKVKGGARMSAFRLKLGPMFWDKAQAMFRPSDANAHEWAGITGKELCRESHSALGKCRNINGWTLEIRHNGEGKP